MSKMKKIISLFAFFFLFSFFHSIKCDEAELKTALTDFVLQLTNTTTTGIPNPNSPWNLTSLPCKDSWKGIDCDTRDSVKNITLDSYNFSGLFNPSLLCNVQSISNSLTVLSLNDNNLQGIGIDQVSNCRQLTRLLISGNKFSGSLPDSFSRLSNLKRLDISSNDFSGVLPPDLTRISGLIDFSAHDNQFSGPVPSFEFSNFVKFNVSNNNFSGPIPSGAGDRFPASSFTNNQLLCGNPLPDNCDLVSKSFLQSSKHRHSTNDILLYSGYILIAFVVVAGIVLAVLKSHKKQVKKQNPPVLRTEKVSDDSTATKSSHLPSDFMNSTAAEDPVENSSFSGDQSVMVSSSLVVVNSPEANALKFENLLKAPAELLGRGKHGSVYKVVSEELGKTLAVKRIKGWTLSANDFKDRMERLSHLKHPNFLPAIAFFSSKQEKLLVYEYQQNGSLFSHLHGSQEGKPFDWTCRINTAAAIADALAFMHQELQQYGIAHGNLKSSNILLNNNLEASITEYGLMIDTDDPCFIVSNDMYQENADNQYAFKADIYGYGVILLEMLTGKNMVQNNGVDLASWVVSVLKEEWTVEVFDKTLIREGANEGRMLHLLQIAIKCTNPSLQARPTMNQVALMITTLKDEEERSMDVSGLTSMYFQV